MKSILLLTGLLHVLYVDGSPSPPGADCFDIFGDWFDTFTSTVLPIPDLNRRHPTYKINTSDISLNDRNLPINYRDLVYEYYYGEPDIQLIDYPPGLNRCGTHYPIWIANSTRYGRVTMCIQTEEGSCAQSFTMDKYDCNEFSDYFDMRGYPAEHNAHDVYLAYALKPAPLENASYCFASRNPDLSPQVFVRLEHDTHYSKLVFTCSFNRLPGLDYYTTIWQGPSNFMKTFGPLEWTDNSFDYIEHTALTEDMLTEGGVTKAGFDIKCIVSAATGPDVVATNMNWSEKKFVGIEVGLNSSMREGESTVVKVKPSVPFGCGQQDVGSECDIDIEVTSLDPHIDCKTGVVVVDLPTGVLTTKADQWNQWTSFNIFGKRTLNSMYGLFSSTTSKIQLKTPKNMSHVSQIWEDYNKTASISIIKNTRTFRHKWCWAGMDPNIRPFTSRVFYLGEIGVFTLYKSEDEKVEVQIETEVCGGSTWWWGTPACICGLVVRAGATVFEISHCQTDYWFADYTACGDRTDVLWNRKLWNTYNLILYTGMRITASLRRNNVNVNIRNSEFTDMDSGGICGPVSDPGGLKMKGGGVTTSLTEYAESWRVDDSKNLFDPAVLESGLTPIQLYSSCNGSNVDDQHNSCSSTTASELCVDDWFYRAWKYITTKTCSNNISLKRKKRRVSYQQRREKRSAPESWTNGWNESSATAFCESKFNASQTVQAVKNVSGVDVDTFMWACIHDIKHSGGTDFSDDAVVAVREQAIQEALSNPALNRTNYRNPSAPKLYDVITQQTCQGDCKNRGSCSQGQCQCSDGYGGTDCSVDLSAPPVLYVIDDEGHCDLAAGLCEQTSVFGNTFSEERDIKCRIERSQVSMSGEMEARITSSTNADQESISKVTCQLPGADSDDVVTAINVSVSQMSNIYSNSLTLLIYDSTCVSVTHSTRQWTIQTDYCLHKGKCHSTGSTRFDDTCWRCQTENGLPVWQRESDERCKPTAACEKTGPGIVTLVFAVGLLLI